MGFFSKDKAIIAQNSASVAAALTCAIITANPDHATTTDSALALFDRVRVHVNAGSLDLAHADPSGAAAANVPGNDSGSDASPGETVINLGKHKGKTIAAVYVEAPDYLTWLVEKSTNEWLVGRVRAFLADKG